jgi:hypothetical protein
MIRNTLPQFIMFSSIKKIPFSINNTLPRFFSSFTNNNKLFNSDHNYSRNNIGEVHIIKSNEKRTYSFFTDESENEKRTYSFFTDESENAKINRKNIFIFLLVLKLIIIMVFLSKKNKNNRNSSVKSTQIDHLSAQIDYLSISFDEDIKKYLECIKKANDKIENFMNIPMEKKLYDYIDVKIYEKNICKLLEEYDGNYTKMITDPEIYNVIYYFAKNRYLNDKIANKIIHNTNFSLVYFRSYLDMHNYTNFIRCIIENYRLDKKSIYCINEFNDSCRYTNNGLNLGIRHKKYLKAISKQYLESLKKNE